MNTNRSHATIPAAIYARASELPDRPAYHLLSDDGEETGLLTWGELDRRARALGRRLAESPGRGERAILLYPSGLDYIVGLYACFYAGVIAVPAYPPRINRHLSRILAIIEDCAPEYVLTDSTVMAGIGGVLSSYPGLQKLRWIVTDTLDLTEGSDWIPATAGVGAPAFLQYTSGSTASPKGVVVTHGNLLRNLALIGDAFGVDDQSVIVSWLPMYHDMGLIGNILATGWLGCECYVMSPAAFVRRPAAWLRAVSRFGATASGGPNFAYALCVQKVAEDECSGLDLSRWRTAFNGAEPLSSDMMRRFAAKFQHYGFRPQAFVPCYGLAEATLLVAGGCSDSGPVTREFEKDALAENRAAVHSHGRAQTCVSSGRPHVDRMIVVDPVTRLECGPDAVGEIWLSDASVAAGYWERPALSRQTFDARLASTGEGPFLRTGDLGVIKDGQLFVLGRLKDLIIIRGRNLYPQDIEETAEGSAAALCPRGAVAFGVERDGAERLVIVAEVAREQRSRLNVEEVGDAVCRAVASEHGVSLLELVLVRPASTLKTSSGKLQRTATREAYLNGSLDVIKVWRNAAVAERGEGASVLGDLRGWLASVVSMKLNIAPSALDLHRPIADYGLDSLTAVELISTIEERLGIELPFELLFVGDPSLTRLADAMAKRLREACQAADCVFTGVPTPIPLRLDMPQAQEAAL